MAYHLLTYLLFPVLLAYTLKLAIKFNSLLYLKQRLGFSWPKFDSYPIWIHCASVGEVNTFLPLLEKLINELPDKSFLITTNTTTGSKTLTKYNLRKTQHCYLPVENNHLIKKFLNHFKPELCLIMETEIWPLLYKHVHQQQIPLSIINGRLSSKTLNAHRWIKKQYKQTLKQVDHIFARSEQDRNLFIQLGADAKKTECVGNLKLSQFSSSISNKIENFTQRPFVLAASTHDNEEMQLANLWKDNKLSDTLLVIVPRHPDRSSQLASQLQSLDSNLAIRSRGEDISDKTNIYLADTLGELQGFMKNASIVFMGGSLIQHGGQNFLEAAKYSKAIILGPYMHNFQNEVDLFKQNHACLQVHNIEELGIAIQSLLSDSNLKTSLEHCAGQLMNEQENIADKYFEKIKLYYQHLL